MTDYIVQTETFSKQFLTFVYRDISVNKFNS